MDKALSNLDELVGILGSRRIYQGEATKISCTITELKSEVPRTCVCVLY
jgi:hypothetical protein